MPAGSYERKEYVGGASKRTLVDPIAAADTELEISSATGWPTGVRPFVITLARDTAFEEKILVRQRVGTVFSLLDRGYDDTTAFDHAAGTTIEHTIDASSMDQANRMANLLTEVGQLISFDGVNQVTIDGPADPEADVGHVLQVDPLEPTGLKIARLVTILLQGVTPDADSYVRMWVDTAQNLLRVSDGATWGVVSSFAQFADEASRTIYLGGDPAAGIATIVGTGLDAQVEVYDGTNWHRIVGIVEGIPHFANVGARDDAYPSPDGGEHAFIEDSQDLQEYRVIDTGEWVEHLNRKVTVSATQPTVNRKVGDIWLQPD